MAQRIPTLTDPLAMDPTEAHLMWVATFTVVHSEDQSLPVGSKWLRVKDIYQRASSAEIRSITRMQLARQMLLGEIAIKIERTAEPV